MPVRLNGPLFSLGITQGGSVGPLTYTKDGRVYPRVSPANPMTENQGNVRQIMIAGQRAIAALGATPRGEVSMLAPVGSRWNSYLFGEMVGQGLQRFTDALAAYAALTGEEQTAWVTAGEALGLEMVELDYAGDPEIDAGEAFYALCVALDLLGLGPGAPSGTNSAAWGTYAVS